MGESAARKTARGASWNPRRGPFSALSASSLASCSHTGGPPQGATRRSSKSCSCRPPCRYRPPSSCWLRSTDTGSLRAPRRPTWWVPRRPTPRFCRCNWRTRTRSPWCRIAPRTPKPLLPTTSLSSCRPQASSNSLWRLRLRLMGSRGPGEPRARSGSIGSPELRSWRFCSTQPTGVMRKIVVQPRNWFIA